MNCHETKELLDRYVDGELQETQRRDVKAHLAACPLCQLEYEKEQKFDVLVKNHVHREEAPFELREAVIDRLEQPSPFKKWLDSLFGAPSFKMALRGVMVFMMAAFILLNVNKPFPLFREAVSGHIAYLRGSYPAEIVSSDARKVSNWFRGKVDFMVKVPDLRTHGFKLLGGRLAHLKDRKVAYLLFEKDGRQVSAFILDTRDIRIPKAKRSDSKEHFHFVKSVKGYQSVLCLNKKSSGVGCVYVFDMPEEKFMQFI